MKQFYRLVTCLVFFLFLSVSVMADTEITVGFLKYSVSGNSATVIGYVPEDLPKDLVIPETIEYNELTFNVTRITGSAFQSCNIIETLVVPGSVTGIANPYYNTETGAFSYCTNLKSVTLKAVSYLGSYAFRGCNQLKWIDFGNSLDKISVLAFNNCSSLTYLVFPPTVSSIKQYYDSNDPFIGCDFIQAVIYLGDNVVSTGLGNVKNYTRKDFLTWDTNEYAYTGKEIEPEYTNNLPFKFKPDDDIILEKDAGSYSATGPITFSNNDMSFTVELPYQYTISQSTITAQIKDATREYGDANPEFEVELSGFVTGEDQSVITNNGSYSTDAKPKSDVGTYEITLSGMEAKNYGFQYQSGNLTVTKAPLTISAGNYTIKQGESIPEFVATYEGFKNDETELVLKTLPTMKCEVTDSNTIGEYPIVISGADSNNYEIQYTNGKLTIEKNANKYKLVYQVDGKEYKSYDVAYGEAITSEADPTKEGYTFSGWSDIPEKMPAKDVEVTGTFTVNNYRLTYKVDDVDYASYEINYGTVVTADDEPTKEGYTFSGWSEIPETMPAKNVFVTGTFTVNKYKLTYKVDGEEYKSYNIDYGTEITAEADPTKEGYSFSGWSEIPEKMPAKDVSVTGSFTINKYKLTYIIDDEEYKSYDILYSAAITPEKEPTKEGYSFSGWSEIPETMPAEDVEVTGTFILDPAERDVITLKETGKGTWCSEYDLDFTNVRNIKAYVAIGYDDISKTIWLARIYAVPAGTGIMVKGDPGEYKIPHETVKSVYTNYFKGNLGSTVTINATDGDMTNYYMKNGQFVSVNGTANIAANRCYLQLPTSVFAGTRSIEIVYDDEEEGTTGIMDHEPWIMDKASDGWYTISGQRISKPTKKGLYIHNGKKIVVK